MGGELEGHPHKPVDSDLVHQLLESDTTWSTLPSLPEPMRLFSAVIFEKMIYIFGGYTIQNKMALSSSYYLDMNVGVKKWMKTPYRKYFRFNVFLLNYF